MPHATHLNFGTHTSPTVPSNYNHSVGQPHPLSATAVFDRSFRVMISSEARRRSVTLPSLCNRSAQPLRPPAGVPAHGKDRSPAESSLKLPFSPCRGASAIVRAEPQLWPQSRFTRAPEFSCPAGASWVWRPCASEGVSVKLSVRAPSPDPGQEQGQRRGGRHQGIVQLHLNTFIKPSCWWIRTGAEQA